MKGGERTVEVEKREKRESGGERNGENSGVGEERKGEGQSGENGQDNTLG